MANLKEDYYFRVVPEHERSKGSEIDWKAYNAQISVILTYSALEARLARFLSRWDLFPSAFNLLAILARTGGEGMHLSRISELLAVSRANVTGLVDVLTRKNLVQRVPSETDRRVRVARLTSAGSDMIQKILSEYYQFNRGLCGDLTDAEVDNLIHQLGQLRSSICADACDAAEA